MSVRICPMCTKSRLAVVDEHAIAETIYVRQTLDCSDPKCGYSWWGRKPADGELEPTAEMVDAIPH